jgi:hypothetical protein
MTLKANLLAGVRLTDNERRLGRLIRDGEGHPAPAPAPAPSEGPAEGEHDDFSEFEQSLEDNDDDDGSEDVDLATPGDDDNDQGEPPVPKDEKGASVQERIDELTANFRESERQLAEERRLREAAEAKLTPPKEEQPKGRSPDERPNPDDYEFGEADSKFIADLSRFEVRQELAEQRREDALKSEVQQVETTWKDNIAKPDIATRYPDFDEKVSKGADRGDWHLSPLGTVMVKSSEVGADVAYHLASNPEESKAIAAMPPYEQAQAIGRLEGRFLYAQQPEKKPAKLASDAPEPPEQRSRGAGGRFQVEADTDDFGSFDKMADGILAKKK